MPWEYKWQKENNDWLIDQDEKQLKIWRDRKAMLERRLAGWTDPEHPRGRRKSARLVLLKPRLSRDPSAAATNGSNAMRLTLRNARP
jgi:hypothetical protein